MILKIFLKKNSKAEKMFRGYQRLDNVKYCNSFIRMPACINFKLNFKYLIQKIKKKKVSIIEYKNIQEKLRNTQF